MKYMLLAIALGFASISSANTVCTKINDLTKSQIKYQTLANGDVKDTSTGLIWRACPLGMNYDTNTQKCTGSATSYTWEKALQAASNLDASLKWRVPNVKELTSILELNCQRKNILPDVFNHDVLYKGVSFHFGGNFWSSTPARKMVGHVYRYSSSLYMMGLSRMNAGQTIVLPVRTAAP